MDQPKPDSPFRATISASNLYRRALCPGSARAEESLMELSEATERSAARDRGILLHQKEQSDESRDDLPAFQKRALEKNARLSAQFIEATFARLGITDPGEPKRFVEREFFLNDSRLEPLWPAVPGHADEIVHYPKCGVVFIFDSKFGRHPVARAESNLQLRCYFVMVHDDLGGERFFPAIRQPYLSEPEDFHATEFAAADIEPARASLLTIIEAAKQPDAPRRPTPEACWFCRALGTPHCPESVKFYHDIKRVRVLNVRPAELEALGEKMLMAKRLGECWVDRVRAIAEFWPELLKVYELTPPRLNHRFLSTSGALRALPADQRLPAPPQPALAELLDACCELSLPRLRDYLAKKLYLPQRDAEALIFRELAAFIESKPEQRSIRLKRERRTRNG